MSLRFLALKKILQSSYFRISTCGSKNSFVGVDLEVVCNFCHRLLGEYVVVTGVLNWRSGIVHLHPPLARSFLVVVEFLIIELVNLRELGHCEGLLCGVATLIRYEYTKYLEAVDEP